VSSAEPAEIEEVRPGLRAAVAAFRYRNFALFWTGALISSTGGWVQNVTIPFVVFKLTDNEAWVGFAGFCLLITAAILGPVGGTLADRFDRRRILIITQSAQATVALALWALWSAGVRSPGVIVALSALSGAFAGLMIGSWQAFVSELVPREALLNAVTLNSAQFNAARAFGPAIGGIVLATLGPGWGFFINAVSFLAVIAALLAMRLDRVVEKAPGKMRVLGDLKETIHYVRRAPGIRTCIFVVAGLSFADSPLFQFVVVFADEVFEVDTWVFGVLSAALGIGAILGTPFVAGWGGSIPRRALVAGAMLLNGVSLILFALSPNAWVGFFFLMGSGAGYLAIASSLNTTIQLQVDERMRGKVLAFYLLGVTLVAPIGALTQGFLVDAIGPRAAFTLAGIAFLGLLALLRARGSLHHLDAESAMDATPELAPD
jgi:MFS family permease